MRRWLKIALVVVAVVLIAAAVRIGFIARAQAHTLITNPIETRHLPGRTPANYGLPFEDVGVTTPDGLALVGWYVPSTNGAVVIAQHGYKADRGEMLNEAEMLHRHGYGVLLSSIRAHDLSEGSLITFGHQELQDLETWLRYVQTRKNASRGRIGYLGNSFGGTLGIQLAASHPEIAAVVASSPFSSLHDTIATSVRFFTGLPPFPFATLITYFAEREAHFSAADIDAKKWIAKISPRPILLMSGGGDVVISKSSGQLLFDAAGEPKELWYEPKVGHAAFDTALPEEYERRVSAFFDKSLAR